MDPLLYYHLDPPHRSRRKNIQDEIDELQGWHWPLLIWLSVLVVFTFVVLVISISAAKNINSSEFSPFKGINPQGQVLDPLDEFDDYVVPCTNNTLGNETVIFRELTLFTKNCDPTGDACTSSICLENRTCSRVFNEPSFNCSRDTDCGTGFNCVGCICTPGQPCSTSEDCDKIFWTDCIDNMCVDGFCQQDFTEGSECVAGVICDENSRCRDCQCIPGAIDQCENDGECEEVEWSDCFASFCEMGTCVSRLFSNSTCVTDGECGQGMECRNCTCQEKFVCSDSSDCDLIEWTTCIENICMDNTCIQNLTSGSECFIGDDCPAGFECKNCTCQVENIQCLVDNDCPSLNYTTCVENICVNQVCIPVLGGGNACSDSSLCSAGEFCDSSCQCMSTNNFVVVQSGTFEVQGAAIFSTPYTLLRSGPVVLFVHDLNSDQATDSNTLSSNGPVIDAENRPPAVYYFSVPVINDPGFTTSVSLGTFRINTDGTMDWFVGGASSFTSGNLVGFHQTTVGWLIDT